MVNAFLRAKRLERSTVPHHPELAVAASAMVLHGFLLGRASVILLNMSFSCVFEARSGFRGLDCRT
jgi:hypothetical protein